MTDHRHGETERRLREALAARADTLTPEHLRPAAVPAPSRRLLPRRTAVALLGLAAVAGCALFVLTNSASDSPVRPADSPSPSVSRPAFPAPASPEGEPDPASPVTTTGP
ncbi:hypothetical protein [Streptomyces sp. B93]|uniref:hypothetical protein n=1 Tax=Streptomyces sp. B93 TaxID=2824875 RepID=UPI001B35C34A|nr:hypothetical protein [Streptomyces sp. B93]MBQ1092793.1 hypothetical protein [Streptomyces sp. B93]